MWLFNYIGVYPYAATHFWMRNLSHIASHLIRLVVVVPLAVGRFLKKRKVPSFQIGSG